MAFSFDIIYLMNVNSNMIAIEDTLFRLEFGNEKLENPENTGSKILHWVETDILPLNRLRIKTKHHLVLNKLQGEIKINICSNCSNTWETLKEKKHKLTIQKGIICNRGNMAASQKQRKDILKMMYIVVWWQHKVV